MKTKLKMHLLALDETGRARMAKSLGTTVPYLMKIAGGFQLPGTVLSQKLVDAVPGMTVADLINAAEERKRATKRKNRRKPKPARR